MGIIISRYHRDSEKIDNFVKDFCGEDSFVSNLLKEFSTFCDLCFVDKQLLIEYGLSEEKANEFIEKFAEYAYPEIWIFLQQFFQTSDKQYDRFKIFLNTLSKVYSAKTPLNQIDNFLLHEIGISEPDHGIILEKIKQVLSVPSPIKETVYISIDVETTGTSPITSSCVMIGVVVFRDFDVDLETADTAWIIDRRHWCITQVENRPMSKQCYDSFWSKQQDLWNYINKNAMPINQVMQSFSQWYTNLSDQYNCIFVARPASFDWQWINCIYDEFGPTIKASLPYSIRCITSMGKIFDLLQLNDLYQKLIYHDRFQVSHHAEDDALYQAYMYLRITNWIKKNLSGNQQLHSAISN